MEEAASKGSPLRVSEPATSTACLLSSAANRACTNGKQRAQPGFYRPRRATETPFYKLVAGHFGEFKRVYAEKYERDFGFWRHVIEDVVHRFLECGVLDHGFARIRCPDCHHEMFCAYSCHVRGFCPSCHQKRTLNLSYHLAQNIFADVPHRQFVFTIPKRFRIFFRHNRKLLGKFARCAWRTLQDVYAHALGETAVPGAVVAIQSFGALCQFHPHLHVICSDGSFSPDGSFTPMPQTPVEPFLKVWEHHVFQMLLEEGRITPEIVENMRTWRYSGFSVHKDVRIGAGDTEGLAKLTQYIARCPFSQARMVKVTPEGKVLYRAEHHNPIPFPMWRALPTERTLTRNFEIFDPLDFLAQVTQHIPDKGQHLIRYVGHYSNRSRGARRLSQPNADTPAPANPLKPHSPAKLRWAQLIRKIYEVDPLVCPECGGKMKILAFIDDPSVIRKILDHPGISSTSGPDPPRSPPPTEVVVDPFPDDLPWGDAALMA